MVQNVAGGWVGKRKSAGLHGRLPSSGHKCIVFRAEGDEGGNGRLGLQFKSTVGGRAHPKASVHLFLLVFRDDNDDGVCVLK